MTFKDLKYIKNYIVNPLYPIFSNMNGYFEESNGNKYLPLVPSNDKNKKYEELWIKIIDLVRSITKNSDDYDEKYRKIKFNSDDKLPLNKTIEISTITLVLELCL